MKLDIQEITGMPDAWTVEGVGKEGAVYKANFYGPNAEKRARVYAWVVQGWLYVRLVVALLVAAGVLDQSQIVNLITF